MLTVNQVKEIVGALKDPIIDVPLRESEGIVDVSIKDNICLLYTSDAADE